MKIRFTLGSAALLLANLILCGCVTAPSSFYTLSSTLPPPDGKSKASPADKGLAVGIGPVRFPEFLDRPQIVSRTNDNRLLMDEFHRWGGSLEDDFLRVLGENLSQLLGTSRILVEPAEARFPLDFQVIADVLRFEGMAGKTGIAGKIGKPVTPGGEAVFKVRWGVVDAQMEQTLVLKEKTYRSRAENSTPAAMVAALSETLTSFSYDLAQQLRKLPKPKSAAAPQ